MKLFKRNQIAAMTKLSGSLTGLARVIAGAFGKGYFSGGWRAPNSCTAQVKGLNFITEIQVTLAAVLLVARYWHAGLSSKSKAYFAGGTTVSNHVAIVETISGATETVSTTQSLSANRGGATGISGPTSGYVLFGVVSGVPSSIREAINYSNDAVSTTGVISGVARKEACGINSPTEGIVAGGERTGDVQLSSIQAFRFATQTDSTDMQSFASSRTGISAVADDNTAFFAGGINSGWSHSNVIEKLSFASRTTASHSSALTKARTSMAATSSPVKGYFSGGSNSIASSLLESLDFATGAISILEADVAASGYQGSSGVQIVPFYQSRGFFFGGRAPGGIQHTSAERILFTTEVPIVISSALSQYRMGAGAVKSSLAAYIGGGNGSAAFNLDRLTFATEVFAMLQTALKVSRAKVLYAQSSIKGYWLGGIGSTHWAYGESTLFATETSVAQTMPMPTGKYGASCVMSLSAGYFLGGGSEAMHTNTFKLTFASDIVSEMGGTLRPYRYYAAGASTETKGYSGGGFGGEPLTSVNKIDALVFATEASYSVSATLATARMSCGAVNSSADALFGGGSDVAYKERNSLEGLHFSTETSYVSGSTLTTPRYDCVGISSN